MADQEWELQYLLDALKLAATGPVPAIANEGMVYELSCVSLAGFDFDADVWLLTDEGRALLALLEAEHCKRRIEAAGWLWCDGPNDTTGEPLAISRGPIGCGLYGWVDFGKAGHRATPEDWRTAAEYAEAHPQGGNTDG